MLGATEYRELNAAARAELPGEFVTLSDGTTHYMVDGPERGPPVVMVHGYSVPNHIWEPTAVHLASVGYRVLRYDLLGRGLSDRPHVNYDLNLFNRQLRELTAHVFGPRPVNVFSICLGGIIAATYADQHPERVARLGFVAPAGFTDDFPFYTWWLRVPGWGESLMELYGDQQLVDALEGHFHDPAAHPEYVEKYKRCMQFAGLKRALVSTARHVRFEDMHALYARLGAAGHRPLLLWGEEDAVLPFHLHERVRDTMPETRFHPIPLAGHSAQYERPDVVNPLIEAFLAGE